MSPSRSGAARASNGNAASVAGGSVGRASTARTAAPARPAPSRPWLTVVPPLPGGPPRAPFVLLVGTLLVFGLGTLLFLHTALAEDSFYLHDLKARSLVLADREQALEQDVSQAASPQRLAARARALGMVRSENPVFIRTADGKILGVPKAGVRPPRKVRPTPATSAPTPTTTASTGPATGKTKKQRRSSNSSRSLSPSPSPAASTR